MASHDRAGATPRSYAVIGAGAVGGYYGARLAAAGLDVHLLLRSDYEHVRRHGFRVESPLGDLYLPRPNVYHRAADMPPVDVALVAVKTTANHLLTQLLPTAGTVVLMQNGLGNEDAVAPIVSTRPLLGGLSFIASTKAGPGHVRHHDGGDLTLAQHGADRVTDTVRAVGEDMRRAGVAVTLEADLVLARWRKLLWNVAFSPLTVLLDALPRQLLAHPRSRGLVEALMREVQTGARACGRDISDTVVADTIRATEAMPTGFPSSMKLDYDAGRPLEVEAILDAPVDAARRAGATMPRTEALAAALSFLTAERSQPHRAR